MRSGPDPCPVVVARPIAGLVRAPGEQALARATLAAGGGQLAQFIFEDRMRFNRSDLQPRGARGAIPAVSNKTTQHPLQRFATTRWTLVLAAAGDAASPQTRDAMSSLACTYWFPLYSFIRRQGYSAEDAEDLTQEFIARLIEKQDLAGVDPSKGRFRSFLLASLRHFLSNQRDRQRAAKRGGGKKVVALDALNAEARYQLEPATDMTPERLFDRRWALALLDHVLKRLHDDYARTGRTQVYDALKPVLLSDPDVPAYAKLGKQLAMSETAIKVAVHRLRARYGQILRDEVAQTVAEDADLDAEMRDLLKCL